MRRFFTFIFMYCLLLGVTSAMAETLVAISNGEQMVSARIKINNGFTEVEKLKADYYYFLPTVSFSSGGNTVLDLGSNSVIPSVDLSFTINKAVTNRVYSGSYAAVLGASVPNVYTNTFIFVTNLTSTTPLQTKTFTITVHDARTNSATASKSYTFKNKTYVGRLTNEFDTIENATILEMTPTWEVKSNSGTATVANKYIYIAYPARLGACTSFTLGGFLTSDWPVQQKVITNAYGYAENYYVYHTEYKQNGSMSYDIH
jgi:hypothetical protein